MVSAPDSPEVASVLRDLARRGLIDEDQARNPLPAGAVGPELEVVLERGDPVFVSACGLRNLHVLNHLYGATVGDLARQVMSAVAAGVLARGDPDAHILQVDGPDLVLCHGPVSRGQVQMVTRHLRDVVANVALPAAEGVVALRPVVSTLELRSPTAWSADDVLRTLHEVRAQALGSEAGLALLEGGAAEEALQRLRRRDASLVWVSEALRENRVEVHFQPVIDLKSGRLADVEALARVRTPERLLAAHEFIDLVHDLGDTAALDAQVLRRVAECGRDLARATEKLFVNVSPLSLTAVSFRDVMGETMAHLEAEGLDLVVNLELTEQALLEHHDLITEIHREHGVHFAVDDFGTGYSSLKTVSDLAVSRVVSTLKIDGSLTRQIVASSEAYKVVLAVAQMARSLELRVIAEHVENPEILARLRTTGIQCGQGFLFDPALPVEALVARYSGQVRFVPEPAPRKNIHLLEPYLERAFAAFYDTLLSDPHFARYFRDEEQIGGLIERQRQTFMDSLHDGPEALRRRYVRLGRLHAELGLPLATFLKGADLLHEELLGVLVNASSEIEVFRETADFFASLRDCMAQGYLEFELPRRRADLQSLRSWAESLGHDPALVGAVFQCAGSVLGSVERRRGPSSPTPPPETSRPPVPGAGEGPRLPTLATCPLTAALEGRAPESRRHHARIHADAESVEFFLARDEDAAVVPLLDGLLGRLPLLLIALRGA
jgi:EAL domain-containing protein (putative c-di-GMP-specific phosphodiesterase class I)